MKKKLLLLLLTFTIGCSDSSSPTQDALFNDMIVDERIILLEAFPVGGDPVLINCYDGREGAQSILFDKYNEYTIREECDNYVMGTGSWEYDPITNKITGINYFGSKIILGFHDLDPKSETQIMSHYHPIVDTLIATYIVKPKEF